MAFRPDEERLIEALKALSPQDVYLNASKRAIVTGFRLYAERGIVRMRWEEGGVLAVDFAGPVPLPEDVEGACSVRIFLDDGTLAFRCSCDADHNAERCSHIVGALVAVLHILNPRLFNLTNKRDAAYGERLEAGFMKQVVPMREGLPAAGGGRAADLHRAAQAVRAGHRFEVIIESSGRGLRAFVEDNGRKVNPADFLNLPWEIGYLMRCSYQEDMSFVLSAFLRRANNLYPLYYQDRSGRQRIEWLGERKFPTWTELEAKGGEIAVRKGFSLGRGGIEMNRLVGNFAFNEDRTQMCYMAAREGWQPWEKLREMYLNDSFMEKRPPELSGREFRIPVDRFRTFQLAFTRSKAQDILDQVRCVEKGRVVEVQSAQTSGYSLVVSRAGEGETTFLIEPRCWSGSYPFRPSQRIVAFARVVEWGKVPASIRTKKRKPMLYDVLFRGLSLGIRKGLGEWLRENINERTFGRRSFSSEAHKQIKGAINRFYEEEVQFHYTHEGWRLITVDKEREKLLFLVPYAVFGPSLFERLVRHGSAMVVREGRLLDNLRLLHELASREGIGLSFEDYPVESIRWEVALDATTDRIDWFEIRPEIRYKGKSIPREVWEQALSRKGILVQDGKIHILDTRSMEALQALTGLWSGTKTSPARRNIVSIPKLRIIDLVLLRKKGIEVKLSPEDEAVIRQLTRFTRIEERALPGSLSATPRHYQKEGYDWLAFLYENRFGACLADDMGLGKTLQAICLIAAAKEGKLRRSLQAPGSSGHLLCLVVVPPSLIFNWELEIGKFCPDLTIHVYRGKDRTTKMEGCDVVLTSYGMIRRDIGKLKELMFDIIVFDEAQAIKNIYADTTNAVRQLRGGFKLALTGTPVENHAGEYFSIMDLTLPGLLGEYREFQSRAKADLEGLIKEVTERTRPFLLRRTKEHILAELPPKIERDVYLELTEEQKRFYHRTVQEVKSTIEAAYRGKAASQAKIIALTAIMKLRQICLTPQLLIPGMKGEMPKVEFLNEKLEELLSESHSALVFSQFTSFLDIVESDLRQKGVPLLRLDGSTPVMKRKEIVRAFQESEEPSVFLLSLKAGGQGLNLTRATYVFHLDPWWNPAVENQASDRIHRIGQVNKVIVTRLLMRHTVEEKMMALKRRKLGLYRALMEAPERSGARSITREDFDFLLS